MFSLCDAYAQTVLLVRRPASETSVSAEEGMCGPSSRCCTGPASCDQHSTVLDTDSAQMALPVASSATVPKRELA